MFPCECDVWMRRVDGTGASSPLAVTTFICVQDVLRPRWLWANDQRTWRYEITLGHGCVPLPGRGWPTFKFANAVHRASNLDPPPP